MFQELAQGIGGAVLILGALALVVCIFHNWKEDAEHKKEVAESDRKMRERFPTVFQKPTEQP